jgi:hypothetical protein
VLKLMTKAAKLISKCSLPSSETPGRSSPDGVTLGRAAEAAGGGSTGHRN